MMSKRNIESNIGRARGIAAVGDKAADRYFEFCTADIRNPNTRRAYHRAACDFFACTQSKKLPLDRVNSPHVARLGDRDQAPRRNDCT